MALSESGLVRAVAGFAAATIATGVIATASTETFADYTPPETLAMQWYDYMNGSTWSQNKNHDDTVYSTYYKHRAVFFGARQDGSSLKSNVIVLYSVDPIDDLLTFEYMPTRDRFGHIRATFKNLNAYGPSPDRTENNPQHKFYLMIGDLYNTAGSNVISSRTEYSHKSYDLSGYNFLQKDYFSFDFYFPCEGDLSISGVWRVPNVPYEYILRCKDGSHHSGSGGTDPGGGDSSGGDSSGGDSSSGSSSGGGGGGSSGDWEESSGGGSNPDDYSWEKDKNTPDLDWNIDNSSSYPSGSEGDTGEKGDTWQLPEYDVPDLPFTDKDLNIPPMPDMNFPSVPVPDFPDPPVLDYQPDISGKWPPAYPGN